MSKAIQTKFLGPTDTKPSRIAAYAEGVRVPPVSADHPKGVYHAHDEAAMKLASRFGWSGAWVRGGSPDGHGNTYVNIGHGDAAKLLLKRQDPDLAFYID